MPSMRLVHYNGTAPVSTGDPLKVSIQRGPAQRINIRNIDAANDLEVSFDGGRNYYRIEQGTMPLDISCMLHFFYVRGIGGTAAFCAVTNEG